MSNHQLHPLQVNLQTMEPFLRLPAPHDKIIITPPRLSDAPSIVRLLNEPVVNQWITGPPQPYYLEHAESWLSEAKSRTDDVLAKLEESRNETILRVTEHCPVRSIREVADDGSDVYLGDVGFERCRWLEIQDTEERKRKVDENQAKVLGEPTIVWSIGGL
jgi:RimJ/RimL family protein N-acetyltransferase